MTQDIDLVGSTLAQYRIVEEIGRGGMGIVYKAWQPDLQRCVAIKVLLAHLRNDSALVQRFRQEAVIAARLNHPNIVTIYEVAESDGHLYIVMEYAAARSLTDLISQQGTIPLDRTMAILRQTATALDYAHRNHFIHRDIKPDNILVGEDDRVFVTDFGIAKAVEGSGATAHLTVDGTIIGTPAYMSPEQIQGLAVDHRADFYSLGVICYSMLGGRPPFAATTTAAMLYAQVHTPPPDVRHLNPNVPPHVVGALARMLAKNPAERFPSAGEFVAALNGDLGSWLANVTPVPPGAKVTPGTMTAGGTPPGRKRSSSMSAILIGSVLAIAVLAVVLAVVFVRNPPPPIPTVSVATATPQAPTVASSEPAKAPTSTSVVIVVTDEPSPTTVLPHLIAFTSDRDGNAEIFVIDESGAKQTNLTNSASNDYWPQWSPDGQRIAFHSYEPGQKSAEIYVMDAQGESWLRLTRHAASDKFPTWSPDGKEIAFSSDRDGSYEIYVTAVDSSDIWRLTFDPATESYPAWSPDGEAILFDSDRTGNGDLYAVSRNGGEWHRLTTSSAKDSMGSWSPDGTRIAFTSEQSGQAEVWLMDSNGDNQLQVTLGGGRQPRWSPDGRSIVYVSSRDGNDDIYVVHLDDKSVERLTHSSARDWDPHWSR